jgi:hypothetical protein
MRTTGDIPGGSAHERRSSFWASTRPAVSIPPREVRDAIFPWVSYFLGGLREFVNMNVKNATCIFH